MLRWSGIAAVSTPRRATLGTCIWPSTVGRILSPTRVRVGAGTEPASEESPESQISVAEAERIGNEPVGIRLGLVIESIPGIQRQALIGRAEAGEQRVHHGGRLVSV